MKELNKHDEKFKAENPELVANGKEGFSVELFINGNYLILDDEEEGDEDDWEDNCLILGLQNVDYKLNLWCQHGESE